MKKRMIFSLSVLFMFFLCANAFATQLDLGSAPDDLTFNSDVDYSNNSGASQNGIFLTAESVKNISTDYNITTATNSSSGILVNNKGKINITGSQSGSNNSIFSYGNTSNGLASASAGSELSISNMDINVSANQTGIYSIYGGKITITGSESKNNKLTANNNSRDGINADDANVSTINIKNMDIEASYNAGYGIFKGHTGNIDITGKTDGSNSLNADNNNVGISSFGDGTLRISNMNVSASSNTAQGIFAGYGGIFEITGAESGINKVTANGNEKGLEAFGVNIDGAQLIIKNSDIDASSNTEYGLLADDSGKIDITGIEAGSNLLTASDNNYGLYVSDDESSITVKNMSIISSSNTQDGIRAVDGGTMTIDGSAAANNKITAVNNGGSALFATGDGSKINISNIDVTLSANYYALNVEGGAKITLTGKSDGSNAFEASYSTGDALNALAPGSEININNMDINIFEGESSGLNALGGGKINITGSLTSALSNKITVANNDGNALTANNGNTEINISNMDIALSENSYALRVDAGAKINFNGKTDGSNTFEASHNDNGAFYVNSDGSEVNLSSMNIDIFENGSHGINVVTGGKVNITGESG